MKSFFALLFLICQARAAWVVTTWQQPPPGERAAYYYHYEKLPDGTGSVIGITDGQAVSFGRWYTPGTHTVYMVARDSLGWPAEPSNEVTFTVSEVVFEESPDGFSDWQERGRFSFLRTDPRAFHRIRYSE